MSHAVLDRARSAVALDRPWQRFATGPVLTIAAVTMVFNLVLTVRGGYWLDEVYMLTAGKYHPSWGYADQPPLVPLLAAAMDWLAPGNLLVLRLPAALATAATVPLAALITYELGGDRRAQLLSAGAFATNLWSAIVGHWLTTYTIEPSLWLLFTWLLVRWVRLRDPWLPLALGVVTGVTIQTKFQIFVLCGTLLLTMLIAGPRGLLRRPSLWVGTGIALLIGLPTLLWQAQHGWPQLEMGPVVAGESAMMAGGRPGTAIWTMLLAGVAGTALLIYGLWRLLFSVELRQYRFIGITFVVLYVFFVITMARPYYLCGLYGVGIAAGAVGLRHRRDLFGGRHNWVVWPAFALSVVATCVAALGLSVHGTSTVMPGLPSDEVVASKTAATYHDLPAGIRPHTAVIGEDYAFASYVEAHTDEHRLPRIHSPHRGYAYFGPPGEDATSVLWVGSDPSSVRPYFQRVRPLSGGGAPMWLCTGRTEPWHHIWPRITHLN